MALLEIDTLSTAFASRQGQVLAVDRLSLQVERGETLAVVGESGCGKSVTALSAMRLLPEPHGRITGGQIRFDGRDLAGLSEAQMRKVRGRDIAMIFQEPMTSLNPVLTIQRQIGETVRLHMGLNATDTRARALEMLELVQIPEPARRLTQYPHELSGGMRQRVMIAMALACDPKLLIADEPTTALDVTIQAQILEILRDLSTRLGMATMLITHDLGVVAEMASRVVVMYAGRMVEQGAVADVLHNPRHPYTVGLLGAVPKLGSSLKAGPRPTLAEIPGTVPLVRAAQSSCAFAPRCPLAVDRCRAELPPAVDQGAGHVSACWRTEDVPAMAAKLREGTP
ncbi:ABC transporter ATP-binding protein (plasmid) [Pseudorhodobacter turbinis]|uniref:ABC transporter ATP-binding protein n=1 Tax=Pseudorhodobacter turbinis TaxID=2500533 RepID=A0A4P8EJV3_9RHOB|nr:ABC transporter ATP-binding protein [Pseudorhodobacter turbinis]QCO57278.1 ABC transporter ATP-binding protein [Pseudorhodobacter turbinis]